uniref:Uncharacterized protein n=1 Tax=Anguilla anguilla TaxID=7936 RepID=A0A0E9TLX6_ANGAN
MALTGGLSLCSFLKIIPDSSDSKQPNVTGHVKRFRGKDMADVYWMLIREHVVLQDQGRGLQL